MLSALERAPAHPLSAPSARVISQLLASMLAQEGQRFHDLCERDVRVERLGLELQSLGPEVANLSSSARGLARSHGGEIWLMQEAAKAEAPKLLGASQNAPSRLPSLDALRRAEERPTGWEDAGSVVLFACKRPLGRGALWLVKSVTPKVLFQIDGVQFEAHAPGSEVSATPTVLLQIAGADGFSDVIVRAALSPAPAHDYWGLMLGLVMGAGVVGGAVGLLLARRHPDEEAVLAELERAAARVAEGDLTSTINLSVGGKADQTFRSFDRMTRELRETRARLAEAERATAFQDIARRIAHEIKNPLSPIQLAMETLRKAHQKRVPGFDEIFEESTRAVLEEVRRLERIVREFSEFARLPKPRPGALNLAALVDEVVQLYRPDDVVLKVEHSDALPSVRVDREQITQVLVNLLQNAFDAARGESSRSPQVRIVLRTQDDRVVLDVDDSGPGVPAEARARIFEPYVTTKPQGTGLGLAIVKRIVSDHGAELEVRESPLGGARFSLLFASESAHSVSIP
jgi:signal transduction histidine kinase